MLNDGSYFTIFLANSLVKYLTVHIIIIIILIVLNLKVISGQFREIKKKAWIALLLIFIFGLYLRLASGHSFPAVT